MKFCGNRNNELLREKEEKKGYITYLTLAEQYVKDMVLCNNIENKYYEGFLELVNGEDKEYIYNGEKITIEEYQELEENGEYVEEKQTDIEQYYIINQNGAEFLIRNTNEIVYYDRELDMYIWAITHIGTSWENVFSDVECDVKK